MRIGFILAGFLFLANPVVHVLDILPDWIGYLLIVHGIAPTAFFIDRMAEAKKLFVRLALITFVRFASILIWPNSTDSTMLLLTFVFSLLEIACFLPAVFALFDGMSFAALWYNGTAVFARKEKVKKYKSKYIDDPPAPSKVRIRENGVIWRNLTICFFCFRTIATLLPELTALQLYDYLGNVTATALNYADFKPLFYTLLGFLVIIAAVIWYVVTVRYWRGIQRDKPFQDLLHQKYQNDVLTHEGLFYALRMRRVLCCFSVAAVTSILLIFDGVNILTGIIPAVFLTVSCIMMGKDVRLAYAAIPAAVLRAGLAIVNLVLQIQFFDEYTYDMIEWIANAEEKYRVLSNITVMEQLAGAITYLVFLVAMMKAIRMHMQKTGEEFVSAQYSKQDRDRENGNLIASRLLLNAVLGVVHFILAALYPYGVQHISSMLVLSNLVSLIWIGHTVYTSNAIFRTVYLPMEGEFHL